MTESVPLYVIGLPKDEPANEILMSKFRTILEKNKKSLSEILEAKISVKSQNKEGTRAHYEITSNIFVGRDHMVFIESGWDILKICDQLCKKLEAELSKNINQRQKESIRKKGGS